MNDDLSLERIIPDQLDEQDKFDQATLHLHTERYAFAIENGRTGNVLDMACGTGYGSYQIIRADKFFQSQVTGVDIDEEAIAYAKKRYAHPSVRFICADAISYADRHGYDTIVSLETIEHLKNPILFVQNLRTLLKKDGVLIVSAPVTPSTDGNPHHLSDFSPARIKKLFNTSGFTIQSELMQVQPYSLKSILYSKNKRLSQTRQHIGRYYLQHPIVFFARIRSLVVEGFNNKYLTLALRKS
jgi:2-polyprenyl-3-methyl-5-hydroxy-6-metoxy-1,4-benzoquinol methylase